MRHAASLPPGGRRSLEKRRRKDVRMNTEVRNVNESKPKSSKRKK